MRFVSFVFGNHQTDGAVSFYDDMKNEFSHTILHGEHILKKAPLPVDGVPPATPAPVAPLPAALPAARIGSAAPSSAPEPPLRPPSRDAVARNGPSEIDRLRAEAEKMRLKMEQMAKDRCAAVDAERKRLAGLREKERMEVHKMQLEKEERDRARREEKAIKMKEYEKKKQEEAARYIREQKEVAQRRRDSRDKPWAQPPSGKRPAAGGDGLMVAGAAANAAHRAAPAWMNAPAKRPVQAASPSNAVREASPRNGSPSPGAIEGGVDQEEYMLKLRERLKAKDEERRQDKLAELAKLREKERQVREARDKERIERAQLEQERAEAREARAVELKKAEKLRLEEHEEQAREERIAERRKQVESRAEKERLKAHAEEAKLAEKKRIATDKMAAEKERLREEKNVLAKRLEERERDRQRREQERMERLNGNPNVVSPPFNSVLPLSSHNSFNVFFCRRALRAEMWSEPQLRRPAQRRPPLHLTLLRMQEKVLACVQL